MKCFSFILAFKINSALSRFKKKKCQPFPTTNNMSRFDNRKTSINKSVCVLSCMSLSQSVGGSVGWLWLCRHQCVVTRPCLCCCLHRGKCSNTYFLKVMWLPIGIQGLAGESTVDISVTTCAPYTTGEKWVGLPGGHSRPVQCVSHTRLRGWPLYEGHHWWGEHEYTGQPGMGWWGACVWR